MKMKDYYFCFPLIIALFLVSACATTAKMNVWKDQTYEGPVKKVLVMGLSQKKGIQLFLKMNLFDSSGKEVATQLPGIPFCLMNRPWTRIS